MEDKKLNKLDKIFLSVIVCTKDRSDQLRNLLNSMKKMEVISSINWELILVDNNSVDETAKVISDSINDLPIRYVFERGRGLSRARNAGVLAARGSHILWTDDDVIVCKDWLKSYYEQIKSFAETPVFGGNITPVLEAGGDKWFADNIKAFEFLLARRNFQNSGCFDAANRTVRPFGANYCVRADLQKACLYDPELGAGSINGYFSEEEDSIQRILELDGGEGRWVQGAEVQHMIPKSRQTKKYVIKYYHALGATTIYNAPKRGHVIPSKIRLKRNVIFSKLRYMMANIPFLPISEGHAAASYAFHLGRYSESLKISLVVSR